ncbi:hypothetical protein PUNSTDRAFT_132714 [Punctularia strigosozonata HHB-11173 SS5]|uniref:uncharacterized protein n=1 Tax=Punctularia strigosozonata (strain HHB-11173) TaxID=741275 RepID=UPI00044169E2|nr:uncharacterized protein PUNSTDRAFT_132714 [Punctularia strigosozonata HHB-11173 SS5]EIN10629.1 hypothetical protein PUNSTDRAFT_132714 [Punctularia strigosozonata HHB-11173 SS5]
MASLMAYAPRGYHRPSIFNIVRLALYISVLVFTVICLGISVHFFQLLQSSDLTRFVPFAIFVCSATLAIFLVLLGFTLRKELNPISTRIELGCLALAGIFWLSLGAFMATSDSQTAEVECFSDESDTEPIDLPGFSTETYHAQYRVLEAFSIFNVVIILGFLLFLMALAVRHHLNGSREVWIRPVPVYGWFTPTTKSSKLPQPATTPQRSRSRTRPGPRPYQGGPSRQDSGRSGRSSEKKYITPSSSFRSQGTLGLPEMAYASRSAPAVPLYDKYRRDASPKRPTPRDKYRRDASPRR